MIKSIRLTNFFSFQETTIYLNDLNVLVGINGAGKSNLLKAIKLLRSVIVEDGISSLLYNTWGGFGAMQFLGEKEKDYVQLEFELDGKVLSEFGYRFRENVFYRIRFHQLPSTTNYYICEKVMTKQDGTDAYPYLQFDNGEGKIAEGKGRDQLQIGYQNAKPYESMLSQIADQDRYPQLYALKEALKEIVVYDNFDTTPSGGMRKPNFSNAVRRLTVDGANLSQILNTIKINDKPNYRKIQDALLTINPNFRGIDFNFIGGNIELMLDEGALGSAVHTTHISDGTLRFLCLLAILYNDKRGKIVCIDELETALHPDMIHLIMAAIQESSVTTQYILPTHSDKVLNQIELKNVYVFEKDDDNMSCVKRFDEQHFIEWAKDYSVGRLWQNGDLGGNRF